MSFHSCLSKSYFPYLHSRQTVVSMGHSDLWAGFAGTAVGALLGFLFTALQDRLRAWVSSPKFEITTENGAPCSVMVPMTNPVDGSFSRDALFLRIFVCNSGSAAARRVEVYAERLHRIEKDGTLVCIKTFPSMNLNWANTESEIYIESMSPKMGRYCDVCWVAGPILSALDDAQRAISGNPQSASSSPLFASTTTTSQSMCSISTPVIQRAALAFNVHCPPNHQGHVVAMGKYRLELLIAAENCSPFLCTLEVFHEGIWNASEDTMLRDLSRMEVINVKRASGGEPILVYLFGQWPRSKQH